MAALVSSPSVRRFRERGLQSTRGRFPSILARSRRMGSRQDIFSGKPVGSTRFRKSRLTRLSAAASGGGVACREGVSAESEYRFGFHYPERGRLSSPSENPPFAASDRRLPHRRH